MKSTIRFIVFQILLVLAVTGGALAIFFLLLQIPVASIIESTKIFLFEVNGGLRNYFHESYVWVVLLSGISVLCVAGILIYTIFIPAISRLWAWVRSKGKEYGTWFLLSFTVATLVAILLGAEYHYRYFSYHPGSYYAGNNFIEENPVVSRQMIADERGMTYYEADSFPPGKDLNGFYVNRQGFPNSFNFNREVIDSLTGTGVNRKKKILYLGDSFLEGIGASVHDKCFLEIFRRTNPQLVMCCAGIRGSDPIQYRLVAEKYVPEIAPDEVCVLFCGWNDIVWLDRIPRPFLPLFGDVKNVGIIDNYVPRGITQWDTLALPTDSAYKLYRQKFSLMTNTDVLSKTCRQSDVTTQLYFALHGIKRYPLQLPTDSLATYRNLKRIKEIADSSGAAFSIAFIPTPPMKNYTPADYRKNFEWAFKDLYPYVHFCPKGTIDESDCSTAMDFHFNDKGQMKFAAFLQNEFINRSH